MQKKKARPSYVLSVLGNRCPRCRQGELFETKNAYELRKSRFMKMHERCPVCGQLTEIEPGFYYGTGYVSYALTVAFSAATFIAWWVLVGISFSDNRIFYWLVINSVLMIILQPVFMRLSRTIWLSWFVKYDGEWSNHVQNKKAYQN